MNRNRLVVILLANIFCCSIYAQVYTPKGTSVEYISYSAVDIAFLESEAANWLSARGWTNDVIKTAPATIEYNCHSYAWYRSVGGTGNYWISAFSSADNFNSNNQNSTPPTPKNIKKYWDDGSYIAVSEGNATKVWYGSCWTWNSSIGGWENWCDHSAIRITSGPNAGKYESKWGAWPRYIHPADKCPYNSSNRQYYVISTAISGPSLICSGSSGSFTVTNAPVVFTWDKSSNLSLTGTGNTVSASANGNSTYAADWVSIKLNGTELVRKEVWVGAPTISSIEGPSSPTSNKTTRYTAKYNTLSAPKSFEWVLNPMSSGCFIYNYGENADVSVVAGNYQLLCRATNTCGTGNYYGISISTARGAAGASFSYNVYPNPVSNILTIEISAEANQAADSRVTQTATTYDISLYNDQGHSLRHTTTKGGTVHLNVSHLRNGTYFLHISDNVNKTPQVMQIMVKH